MTKQPKADFYVYLLFDAHGSPRYVGKGRLGRWNQHRKPFVAEAVAAFGDLPRVKVRERLSEHEAYSVEHALICAIGREPYGPLVNRTDKGSGPNSRQVAEWHASRPFEERSVIAKKGRATWRERTTPEQRHAMGSANAIAQGREAISERSRKVRAAESPEMKSLRGQKAGAASALAQGYEKLAARGRKSIATYMANTTPQQRREIAKKTGLAKASTSDLSAWGTKGANAINAGRTPEQRTAFASAAAVALHASRSPEQRAEIARKAGLKGAATITPAMRSQMATKRAAGMSPQEKREIAMKAVAGRRLKAAQRAREKLPLALEDSRDDALPT